MITENDQERVKRMVDVVDIIEDFVTLRKKGQNYEGYCPFHDDHRLGNFVVSPKKNRYKCFSCGAQGDGIAFLMSHGKMSYLDAIRYAAAKYGVFLDESDERKKQESVKVKKVAVRTEEAKAREAMRMAATEISYLPMSMVTAREETTDDILCKWLRELPWPAEKAWVVDDVLRAYHVGHSKDGKTIFWQIDEKGQVHTGKLMRYKPDGHRDKSGSNNFDWIHSRLIRAGVYDKDKANFQTCLFGLHLVSQTDERTVHVVESEKTALICAIAYHGTREDLWIASGGMSNLTSYKLQPLIEQGRKIIVYCDQDGESNWRQQVKRIGYTGLVLDAQTMRRIGSMMPDNAKMDLGDVIVWNMTRNKEEREREAEERRRKESEELEIFGILLDALNDMIRENPNVKQLVDGLDCEIVTDEELLNQCIVLYD